MRRFIYFFFAASAATCSFAQDQSIELLKAEWQKLKSRLPSVEDSRASNGTGLFSYGDFLYWRATADRLSIILRETATSAITSQDEMLQFDPSYEPGFRLGLGYHFPEVQWDLGLVWTHYKSDTGFSFPAEPFVTYVSTQGTPGPPGFFDPITGRQAWSLDYHVVDLMLAPNFFSYKKFSFQPQVGLRASWINQFVLADVIGEDAPFGVGIIEISKVNVKVRSLAIEFGSKMRWSFVDCFHLFGTAHAGLGYSRQRMKGTFFFEPTSLNTDFQIKTGDKTNPIRPNVQFSIGLEADPTFFNDRLKVHLYAAYEQVVWFDQYTTFTFFGEQTFAPGLPAVIDFTQFRDDLQLSGLTVGAGIDF